MMPFELWMVVGWTILVAVTGIGFLLWGWKVSRSQR